MKKILFIASERIELKSGGGLANRAFLDSLMKHYPNLVDVIQLHHYSTDTDSPHFYYVPAISKWKQLFQILLGHPHRLYLWMPQFLKAHGKEYSHCIINQSWYGDIIPMLKHDGIKVAVIHHNYEVKYQMDNKLPSTLYGLTSTIIRKNERMAFGLSDLNLYLTQNDYNTINNAYGTITHSKQSIVGLFEPASFQRKSPIAPTPLFHNVMAICGSLNNKQTEDSICDFFNHYYQILIDIYNQNFQLLITGRSPGKKIQSKTNVRPQTLLIPNPEHIEDIIEKAGIFICPVNCGSGFKLRIMDGMRLGLPILTHEVSAHGYEPFFSFPWFCVYHDAVSFKNGLRQIISQIQHNPNLKQEIIECYYNYFSFGKGHLRFLTAISNFLQS